jgi:hypothetical protein
MEGDIYTVTVANPSGSITRETRISVIRSPQIIRPPELNYRIFTGSPFNITVSATGGFVYYIWHRGDTLIQVRFPALLSPFSNLAVEFHEQCLAHR